MEAAGLHLDGELTQQDGERGGAGRRSGTQPDSQEVREGRVLSSRQEARDSGTRAVFGQCGHDCVGRVGSHGSEQRR